MATDTTPKSETTPKRTTRGKATTPKATTPKAAKPKADPSVLFAEGAIVYANHPRLHPIEGQAKVLVDFHRTNTYVRLAFLVLSRSVVPWTP